MPDIEHVFVLMLENRSFDHMFALSNIPGIRAATSANFNQYQGQTYNFGGPAPEKMPSDPLHGFCDVLEQLCDQGSDCSNVIPYPPRDNIGFVANYATTKVRSGLFGHKPLPQADYHKIMLGVETERQVPALYTLATQFVLCDAWHSSLPGPTWPNRFFVHGASSDGMADAPRATDIFKWEVLNGFEYPNGSVFDRLGHGNYRLYQDIRGPLSGLIPQVSALKGISFFDVHGLHDFEHDLAHGYHARYTFIEPAYGDIVSDSYLGGSSQHPMDGLAPGDRLVARVYNTLRKSRVWESSLLIITYDEHGGFYDSVPPGTAVPPGDGAPRQLPDFDFSVYGVRVPAVIVSPWLAKGQVDPTLYDHASVARTLGKLFGFDPLTERDHHANDLLHLLTDTFRDDCPEEIPEILDVVGIDDEAVPEAPDEEPIEDGSNLQAFLYAARKADRERVGDTLALARFQPVQTRGEARRYLEEVMPQLQAMRGGGIVA